MSRGVALLAVALVFLAALPARADDLGAAINAVRSSPLQVDGTVDGFAQAAADRIANGQALVHSNLSGILGTCSAAGEVMGYGPDIGLIMAGFANSPGHWAVITQNTWNAMGTGATVDGNGRLWVAVVFCTLPNSAPPPPTTAPPTTAPPTTAPPPPPVTTTTVAPPPATPTTSPPVVEAQVEVRVVQASAPPVIVRVGALLSLDGTTILLGSSPFLPAADWQTFRIPSIS